MHESWQVQACDSHIMRESWQVHYSRLSREAPPKSGDFLICTCSILKGREIYCVSKLKAHQNTPQAEIDSS